MSNKEQDLDDEFLTGNVKWFNNDRGYGFIEADSKYKRDRDFFAHYSKVLQKGYKSLQEGQRVKFREVRSDKGFSAEDIVVMSANEFAIDLINLPLTL